MWAWGDGRKARVPSFTQVWIANTPLILNTLQVFCWVEGYKVSVFEELIS